MWFGGKSGSKAYRTGHAVGWLAFSLALGAIAYGLLFTRFMIYDDEGYVLWSVRQFLEGQPLYEAVFSQYGPFFYAFYKLVYLFGGWPFDNEMARWLTLCYWMGASLTCGGIAVWLTRSAIAGMGAAGFAFAVLADMTAEPFHPGGLLAILTAAGAAAGLALEGKHPGRAWITCALIGTAMALTKINVGALFLIAFASWILLQQGDARMTRLSARLVAVGIIVAPLLLMHRHWPATWVATYALVFIAAGLTLLFSALTLPRPTPETGLHRRLAATIAVMAGFVGVVALLARTPPHILWQAVVVAPLRHPGVYAFPMPWVAGVAPAAVLTLVLFAIDQRSRTRSWRPISLAILRLILGGWYLLQMREADTGNLHRLTFQFAPLLAWTMVVPLRSDRADAAAVGRGWIAWVSLWQMLQAYPVGGTQQAWAAFTWVPLIIAGWWNTVSVWQEHFSRARLVTVTMTAALLGATTFGIGYLGRWAHLYYTLGEPLGIPGASRLRVPDDLTTALRVLIRNIQAHGHTLFSFPGMFSFNIWTSKPTPTAANVTHWFSLLTNHQQQEIIEQLLADPRAVVVMHRFHIHYLIAAGFGPQGPLKDFLLQDFQPAIRLGHYDLWVRRGRSIAALSTGTLETNLDGRQHLALIVSQTTTPIAALQIRRLSPSHRIEHTLPLNAQTPWVVTAIDDQGKVQENPPTQREGFATRAPSRVLVPLPPGLQFGDLAAIEMVLVDAAGATIERLRFNEVPQIPTASARPAAD